jgi:hypothetical protein
MDMWLKVILLIVVALLSTWTEILACFERGFLVGSAWDSSEKMYKNICPGT